MADKSPLADRSAIGIDLGGTKIKGALVSPDGKLRFEMRERTQSWRDPIDVVEQLAEMIATLHAKNGDAPIVSIGIGVAGQIEASTGEVTFAPNLGWRNFPLREKLREILHLPLVITNDVRAAAFGEWRYGAGKGIDDLVVLFVGTGIGGCLISGGRILTGHANTAGELGHTTILLGGPLCRCGNSGCLEALAGGWAIARRAKELIAEDHKAGETILEMVEGDIKRVTAKSVSRAAQIGDPLGSTVMAEMIGALIGGCTSFVNAVSPKRIIFGGGVVEGYPELIPLVEAGVRERGLPAAVKELEVVKASLGSNAGLIGAARMAMELEPGEET